MKAVAHQLRLPGREWTSCAEHVAHGQAALGVETRALVDAREVERLSADARRYRWLRREDSDFSCIVDESSSGFEFISGDAMDRAIDAALTQDRTP